MEDKDKDFPGSELHSRNTKVRVGGPGLEAGLEEMVREKVKKLGS